MCSAIFDTPTCYVLGNGERANFWKDRCLMVTGWPTLRQTW
jgi:hypothetical protein